ncbi:MAG: T9SS type A sorting domain-containing protein [Bacteroidota bacterium]
MHRLCVVVWFSLGLVPFLTSAQNLNLSDTAPDLRVCGPSQTFSATVSNSGAGSANGLICNLVLPAGVTYTSGSLSGSNASLISAGADTVKIDCGNLAGGGSRTFSYDLAAGCAANDSGSVSLTYFFTYAGGNATFSSVPFDFFIPSVTLDPLILNQGGSATTWESCLKIRNGGLGALDSLEIAIVRDPAELTYSNLRLGTGGPPVTSSVAGDTIHIRIQPSDITAYGDADGMLSRNDSLEICFDLAALTCSGGSSTLLISWGCNEEICVTETVPVSAIPVTQAPSISYSRVAPFQRCYGQGPNPLKVVYTNSGSGRASNVQIEIIPGYQGGAITGIDTSSFRWIPQGGTPQTVTLSQFRQAPQSGEYLCLGTNDIWEATVQVPDILPGQSDTLVFDLYECCKTWCAEGPRMVQRTYSEITYTDSCQNPFPVRSDVLGGRNFGYIGPFTAFTPPVIADGDSGWVEVQHTRWYMYASASSGYVYFDLVLPPGLTWTGQPGDLYYQNTSNQIYLPDSVTVIGDTVRGFYFQPLPGGLVSDNAKLRFQLRADCSTPCSGGLAPIGLRIYQVPEAGCGCNIVLGCHEFEQVLNCGVCIPSTAGMLLFESEIRRTNYGLPDNDNDGLPDASGSLDFNQVFTNRLMFSDTLLTRFTGVVTTDTAHPDWAEVRVTSDFINGTRLTWLNASAEVRVAGGPSATLALAAPSTVDSGIDRNYSYQFDTTGLGAVLGPGYVFTAGDTIQFEAYYRLSTNIGALINAGISTHEVGMVDNGTVYSSGNAYMPILQLGYGFYDCCDRLTTANGCAAFTMEQRWEFLIGTGGDAFPFEYRNWGEIDFLKASLHPGYQIEATTFQYYRSFRSAAQQLFNLYMTPDSVVGDSVYYTSLRDSFSTNGGSLPLSDDSFFARVYLRLQPTCEVPPNQDTPLNYLFRVNQIPALNTPGGQASEVPGFDWLRYYAPVPNLVPLNPVAPGIENEVSWQVRLENISQLGNSDSLWVAARSPSGSTVPLSIIFAGNTYPMAAPGDAIALPALNAGNNLTFQVNAAYNRCTPDTLLLMAGWDCNGTPSNLASAICISDTVSLIVNPAPSLLQGTMLLAPGPYDMCDSIPVEISINSAQIALAEDIRVEFLSPVSNALSFVPASAEMRYPAGGSFLPISDPSQLGNAFYWDLGTVNAALGTRGLPGTLVPDSNLLTMRFMVSTDCDFASGEQLLCRITGRRPCGEAIPPVVLISDPILINGTSVQYSAQVRSQATVAPDCPTSGRMRISVLNTGPGIPSVSDSIRIDLEPSFSYLGGFSAIANPPASTAPVQQFLSGGTRLVWPMSAGLLVGDSMVFEFDFAINWNVSCGVQSIRATSVVPANPLCIRNNVFCNSAATTGSDIAFFNTVKPDLFFSYYVSRSTLIPGGQMYYYNGTLNNAGLPIVPGNMTRIGFFCDTDQNASFSPGDTPIHWDSTYSGISSSTPYSFADSFFIPSAACPGGQQVFAAVVPDQALNICACDSAWIADVVLLQSEELELTGKALAEGNFLTCRTTLGEALHLVEYLDGATWRQLNEMDPTQADRHTFLHPQPEETVSYRIRTRGTDSQNYFSNVVRISRSGLEPFRIWPNPTAREVYLSGPAGTEFTVHDLYGRTLLQGVLKATPSAVDTESWAKGYYLVTFQSPGRTQTMRLLTR